MTRSTIEAVIEDKHELTASLEAAKQEFTASLEAAKQVVEKNYENLINKPYINDVELRGNKTFEDLGDHILTNTEILNLYKKVKGM